MTSLFNQLLAAFSDSFRSCQLLWAKWHPNNFSCHKVPQHPLYRYDRWLSCFQAPMIFKTGQTFRCSQQPQSSSGCDFGAPRKSWLVSRCLGQRWGLDQKANQNFPILRSKKISSKPEISEINLTAEMFDAKHCLTWIILWIIFWDAGYVLLCWKQHLKSGHKFHSNIIKWRKTTPKACTLW